MPEQFTYLATPYSRYPHGLEEAYHEAKRAANLLREQRGIRIYCPIETSHPVAMSTGIDPRNHQFWIGVCRHFMELAENLIVVEMEGWRDSKGIAEEVVEFRRMQKPVEFIKWPLG